MLLFHFYCGAKDELTADSMLNKHRTIEQQAPNLEHSKICCWDDSSASSGSLMLGTKNLLESQKHRLYFPMITVTNTGH